MKIRKIAAALLTMALCLGLCLPAALAEGTTQQVASVENLTVNVRCTGSAGIPREELTVRLTPRDGAPMPENAKYLEVTLNTADCTRDSGYQTSAEFAGKFTYTKPGNYQYEVVQLPGSAANGTYDDRVMIVHVSTSWNGDTFGRQVWVTVEGQTGAEKLEDITFTNRYASPSDPDGPIYIPDDPYWPDPVRPVVPEAPTPVNPPVADATPTAPEAAPAAATPAAATPVNPPVADARPQKLIQTGQLNWPVPLLAGAGAVLMAVGIVLKKRKDDHG